MNRRSDALVKPVALIGFILLGPLAGAAGTSAQGGRATARQQTFVGIITDEMCETGDHSQMRMGSTDADCTNACVSEHGAQYVLYDGKAVYRLDDQRSPQQYAGKRVRITGTLNAATHTIRVDRIRAAQ